MFLNGKCVVVLTEIAALRDVCMESTSDGKGVTISWTVLHSDLYDNFTVLYCVPSQNVRHACSVCRWLCNNTL